MPKVPAAFSVLCFEDHWLNSIPPGSKLANLHYLLLLSPLLLYISRTSGHKKWSGTFGPNYLLVEPEPRINDLLLLCRAGSEKGDQKRNQTNSVIKRFFMWLEFMNQVSNFESSLRL